MAENKNETMPVNKIYETIGRMYLQLISAHDNSEVMVRQIAELSEQNTRLQGLVNQYQTGKTPDLISNLVASGIPVKDVTHHNEWFI